MNLVLKLVLLSAQSVKKRTRDPEISKTATWAALNAPNRECNTGQWFPDKNRACRQKITCSSTLLTLLKRGGGSEVARGAVAGTGNRPEPDYPLPGDCGAFSLWLAFGRSPAPWATSAPAARFKSVKGVAERLVSCLHIVFLPGNHPPALHSRLAGPDSTDRPLAAPRENPVFLTLRSRSNIQKNMIL